MADAPVTWDDIELLDSRISRLEGERQQSKTSSKETSQGETINYHTPWIIQYYGPYTLPGTHSNMPRPPFEDPGKPQHTTTPVTMSAPKTTVVRGELQKVGQQTQSNAGSQSQQRISNEESSNTSQQEEKTNQQQTSNGAPAEVSRAENEAKNRPANSQQGPTAPNPLNPNDYRVRRVYGRFSVGSNPPMLIVPTQQAYSFKGHYNIGYDRRVPGLQGHWQWFTAGGDGSTEDLASLQLVNQIPGITERAQVTPQLVRNLQARWDRLDLVRDLIVVWVPDLDQFNLDQEQALRDRNNADEDSRSNDPGPNKRNDGDAGPGSTDDDYGDNNPSNQGGPKLSKESGSRGIKQEANTSNSPHQVKAGNTLSNRPSRSETSRSRAASQQVQPTITEADQEKRKPSWMEVPRTGENTIKVGVDSHPEKDPGPTLDTRTRSGQSRSQSATTQLPQPSQRTTRKRSAAAPNIHPGSVPVKGLKTMPKKGPGRHGNAAQAMYQDARKRNEQADGKTPKSYSQTH